MLDWLADALTFLAAPRFAIPWFATDWQAPPGLPGVRLRPTAR
jgi:hypothetical protein